MGIAGTRPVTGAEYRALMSAFPTGVAVITAVDAADRPHGMTCTSLTSVTVSPPILLACLDVPAARWAPCWAAARSRSTCCAPAAGAPLRCSPRPSPDRFDRAVWRPSRLLGVPWLPADSFAMAECAVRETVDMGDHVIVIGAVLGIDQERDVPLLYGLRGFAPWPGETAL